MASREEIFNTVRNALADGRPDTAEKQLRTFLSVHSRDVDARYQYARCLAALGQLEKAVAEFRRLLAIQPQHIGALVDMGIALSCLGQHQSALVALDRAKRIDPQPALLYFALGQCQLGLEDPSAAEASFRLAIARNLRIPEVYEQLGTALLRSRRYAEAIECFRQAIALNPRFASAKINLGDAEMRAGNVAAAVDAYESAAALQPDDAYVHGALGTALLAAEDPTRATQSLERALSLDSNHADVAVNLATAHERLNRYDKAAAAYGQALSIKPSHAEALLGYGLLEAEHGDPDRAAKLLLAAWEQRAGDAEIALKIADKLDRLGWRGQALEIYEQAGTSCPTNPDLHDAHGRLMHRLGRYEEALACYGRALNADPSRRVTRLNRAHALESQGSISEAMGEFRYLLAGHPTDQSAVAGLASCAFRICDWETSEAMVMRLLESTAGIDEMHPFLRFAADLEPVVLAEASRRTAGAIAVHTTETPLAPYTHDRLRIAYLSPDFRQHPVAHALAGVIERHDRQRVESIGVSLVAPDGSDIATRLKAAFDEFIDCGSMVNGDIVKLLREREIDIAIDLAGYTSGSRAALFASRIAPVQVNYLGFPGSTGARYLDFMIADEIVVPAHDEHFYDEKIVRLPHSYLPFDRDRELPDSVSRTDAGLPATGIVFCGFSNGYKIARKMFDVWLKLLEDVPGSVLWLRGGHRAMEDNLMRAASERRVSVERLVFAPMMPRLDEHMARLQLADVFLDTAPYNAHTTAAEALWAGIPMITCRGRTFAARVGASVLAAAGLPELISEDLESYFDSALRLARSPRALDELRERIQRSRNTAPLFDSAQYVRDFESALSGLRGHS